MDLSLASARAPIDAVETTPEGGGELSQTVGRPPSVDPPNLGSEVVDAEGASDLRPGGARACLGYRSDEAIPSLASKAVGERASMASISSASP